MLKLEINSIADYKDAKKFVDFLNKNGIEKYNIGNLYTTTFSGYYFSLKNMPNLLNIERDKELFLFYVYDINKNCHVRNIYQDNILINMQKYVQDDELC